MVICLEWDADLHMAQLMPLPLTASCFSKIQIVFIFLVYRLTWVVPEKEPFNGCVCVSLYWESFQLDLGPTGPYNRSRLRICCTRIVTLGYCALYKYSYLLTYLPPYLPFLMPLEWLDPMVDTVYICACSFTFCSSPVDLIFEFCFFQCCNTVGWIT